MAWKYGNNRCLIGVGSTLYDSLTVHAQFYLWLVFTPPPLLLHNTTVFTRELIFPKLYTQMQAHGNAMAEDLRFLAHTTAQWAEKLSIGVNFQCKSSGVTQSTDWRIIAVPGLFLAAASLPRWLPASEITANIHPHSVPCVFVVLTVASNYVCCSH